MTAPERVKIVPSLSPLDPQNIDRWNVIRFLLILKKMDYTKRKENGKVYVSIRALLTNVFACINQLSTMDNDNNQRNHRRKPQVFYPLKLCNQCNGQKTRGFRR